MDLSLQHASATPVQGKGGDCAADAVVGNVLASIAIARPTVGDDIPTKRAFCRNCDASLSTLRADRRIRRTCGRVEMRPGVGAILTDNRRSPVPRPALQTCCNAV